MAIFKIKADPTFKAKVGIPLPGGTTADVEFEFRHRTIDGWKEFIASFGSNDKMRALLHEARTLDFKAVELGVDTDEGKESLARAVARRTEVDELVKQDDIDYVMSVAVGWGMEDPFDRENIGILLQNYHGAGNAIAETYVMQLRQARIKN